MKAFKIGRSRKNDVTIDHGSVSREHAELVATDEGRYYLTDCDSANGTCRRKNGKWARIRQEFVAPDEAIRLGDYETTARQLALSLSTDQRAAFIPESERQALDAARPRAAPTKPSASIAPTPPDDLPRGKVERNPETGEIIRSKK